MENICFEKVSKRIDELSSEYLSFLADISNIESPTNFKQGVDEVGRYVAERARLRGWDVKIHKEEISGDAVSITFNKQSCAAQVCLSAHMDTVHPKGTFGYPPVKIEEKIIKGPGTSDCKSGIAMSFLVMAALEDSGYKARPIKLILQSDEEISSKTSDKRTVAFMAEEAKGAVAFFNVEPGRNKGIVVERKGIIRYKFEVKGYAAHSAACYEGSNAVTEAAYKIIELEKWKDREGITCNCGVISGGTAANTVAERCTFFADIRYSSAEELRTVKERVLSIAKNSYVEGTSTEIEVVSERINMARNEKNLDLAVKMAQACEKYGLGEIEFVKSNGGSDAADMTCYGIPVVDSVGPVGEYIHSDREYMYIDSLAERAKRVAATVIELL